ncbi:MAG: regulatory protein MerR [Dehalococcoidia bacterium]|nr:regulatory protein MerR [Dehalococcoidia bacterium]
MPLTVDGQTYYRTAEVCALVGIAKNTLFRWIREGSSLDAEHRDRRGWRLFTRSEVDRLRAEVNRVHRVARSSTERT